MVLSARVGIVAVAPCSLFVLLIADPSPPRDEVSYVGLWLVTHFKIHEL